MPDPAGRGIRVVVEHLCRRVVDEASAVEHLARLRVHDGQVQLRIVADDRLVGEPVAVDRAEVDLLRGLPAQGDRDEPGVALRGRDRLALLIAGDKVAAETSATGDPSTLISRPSLVTLAFRPLPNTGTPSIVWR
jgi:hypothetical protein